MGDGWMDRGSKSCLKDSYSNQKLKKKLVLPIWRFFRIISLLASAIQDLPVNMLT